MNKSRFVCLLAAVTMCTAGWAKDIPFKAVFTGGGVVSTGTPCSGKRTNIDTNGIVTDLNGVRTIQIHCADPLGTDPLSFANGTISATNSVGDGYTATYSGKLVPTATSATDNVFVVDGQFTITGGTGRYQTVKGGGSISGLQNSVGYFGWVFTGTITVPDTPTVGPRLPLADAGADFITGVSEFSLDGSKSSDPDGGSLIYSWRSIGRTATIIGTNVANPRIQAISAFGQYIFELTVTNAKGLSSVAIVKVMFIGN
jgi:hypothetical protein